MSEKDRYNPESMSRKGVQKRDPIKQLGKAAVKSSDKRDLGRTALNSGNKK